MSHPRIERVGSTCADIYTLDDVYVGRVDLSYLASSLEEGVRYLLGEYEDAERGLRDSLRRAGLFGAAENDDAKDLVWRLALAASAFLAGEEGWFAECVAKLLAETPRS